jgi:hypothetical protein
MLRLVVATENPMERAPLCHPGGTRLSEYHHSPYQRRTPMTRKHPSLSTEKTRARARALLARAQEHGARGLRLRCPDGHVWNSDIDPRSEDRAGVRKPRCPKSTCKQFYVIRDILRYTHDPNKKGDQKCRRATKPHCICSCSMDNHGIDSMLAGRL